MAEAGKLKDGLSETLHGAVTQPFKTKSFWICSEVYLSVVRAGESHLLWQGAPPQPGMLAAALDVQLEVN